MKSSRFLQIEVIIRCADIVSVFFCVFRQYLGYFLFAKRVKFSAITTPFAILYQEPAYIHNARNDMRK